MILGPTRLDSISATLDRTRSDPIASDPNEIGADFADYPTSPIIGSSLVGSNVTPDPIQYQQNRIQGGQIRIVGSYHRRRGGRARPSASSTERRRARAPLCLDNFKEGARAPLGLGEFEEEARAPLGLGESVGGDVSAETGHVPRSGGSSTPDD